MTQSSLRHHQVIVEGASIHVVEAGMIEKPTILFLHGYPENWAEFEQIMVFHNKDFHLVVIDLPGIGKSDKIPSNDKRTIAKYVNGIINVMNLKDVTLVGHDVGGMIVYAYLQAFPNELTRAVIMNVAIPGIDPWSEIKRNPYIWHFAFSSIPELPETLVTGKQRIYFNYFFNSISANPEAINEQARNIYVEAYSSPDSLKTGFEWYRAFPQDENDNISVKGNLIKTPVLYLRGEREYGDIELYLKAFRESGLSNVQGKIILNSGHYAPEEQPDEVWNAIKEFIQNY